jgi:hypothetical protein
MDKLIGSIPILTPTNSDGSGMDVRVGNGVVVLTHEVFTHEKRTWAVASIWLPVSSCELLENALRIARRELERRNK